MSIETMKSLKALLNHIENNFDKIYVREMVNEKWGDYSLAELPSETAIRHIFRWIRGYEKEIR